MYSLSCILYHVFSIMYSLSCILYTMHCLITCICMCRWKKMYATNVYIHVQYHMFTAGDQKILFEDYSTMFLIIIAALGKGFKCH